jgi:hypothetical protein
MTGTPQVNLPIPSSSRQDNRTDEEFDREMGQHLGSVIPA